LGVTQLNFLGFKHPNDNTFVCLIEKKQYRQTRKEQRNISEINVWADLMLILNVSAVLEGRLSAWRGGGYLSGLNQRDSWAGAATFALGNIKFQKRQPAKPLH